jgi:hypothetical protein
MSEVPIPEPTEEPPPPETSYEEERFDLVEDYDYPQVDPPSQTTEVEYRDVGCSDSEG